jgi:Icc-related predicted phosphoesterase
MRILYVTDLHGSAPRYERALEVARRRGVRAIVNGGDMYPKDGPLVEQHRFVTGFLDRHFAECSRAGLACLCMPANDDLEAFDGLLEETCGRHEGVLDIARRRVELDGVEFVGFDLVADHPFGLKDRARMDSPGFRFEPQLSGAVVSDGAWPEFRGLKRVGDWFAYARTLPTIEDELGRLERPRDPEKAVYVIHMPPSGAGLDVCSDGRAVGSGAVREFLMETQPLVSLHGHIHESPRVTGTWRTRLGRTVAVQPGQAGRLTYVLADLESMEIERVVE